jgi:hypothetical protein
MLNFSNVDVLFDILIGYLDLLYNCAFVVPLEVVIHRAGCCIEAMVGKPVIATETPAR